MIILLLKITVLLASVLASLPLLHRASAAMRHLVCVCALAGALILALTLLAPPQASAFRIDTSAVFAPPPAMSRAAGNWPLQAMFIAVWAFGSALLLAQIAIGYATLSRLLRTATRLDLAAPIPVLLADVTVPVVSGLLHPVILLPRSAESWSSPLQTAALKHELEHLRRKDLWTMLIARLACAIYWFHPLAWAVARHARDEQESACDDAVLSSGFEPALYAEALVSAARNLTSTRLIGCHMLTRNTLKSRIARLFDHRLTRVPSRANLRAAAVAAALAIAFIGILVGPQQARAGDDKVYKVGGDITSPRVLSKIDPDYTPEAKAAKISGTVVLNAVIGTDGLAHDVVVVQGIDSGLDEKGVEAVQRWQFQPALKDGEPVKVRVTIEINFRLQ